MAKKKDRREDYRKLRNEIVSKIRRAEKEHLKAKIESSIGDTKKHWRILREITNKTNNKAETISAFYYKGVLIRGHKMGPKSDFLSHIHTAFPQVYFEM